MAICRVPCPGHPCPCRPAKDGPVLFLALGRKSNLELCPYATFPDLPSTVLWILGIGGEERGEETDTFRPLNILHHIFCLLIVSSSEKVSKFSRSLSVSLLLDAPGADLYLLI